MAPRFVVRRLFLVRGHGITSPTLRPSRCLTLVGACTGFPHRRKQSGLPRKAWIPNRQETHAPVEEVAISSRQMLRVRLCNPNTDPGPTSPRQFATIPLPGRLANGKLRLSETKHCSFCVPAMDCNGHLKTRSELGGRQTGPSELVVLRPRQGHAALRKQVVTYCAALELTQVRDERSQVTRFEESTRARFVKQDHAFDFARRVLGEDRCVSSAAARLRRGQVSITRRARCRGAIPSARGRERLLCKRQRLRGFLLELEDTGAGLHDPRLALCPRLRRVRRHKALRITVNLGALRTVWSWGNARRNGAERTRSSRASSREYPRPGKYSEPAHGKGIRRRPRGASRA